MSQGLGSTQGTLEERFSYLLQPIRDLAKNWDVDIAHFLEEYLEEIEKIQITFDDGATTMNFSEAALLIQGSAGVYAKKVEYLHSLVYQVLDLVTQKRKQKGKSGEGGDNENDDEGHFDADEQFLPLDDIPENEGSYTKEQDVTSNKNVRPVPEMPTRLIPLEEAEKGDNSLYNKKGEVMGNHCDFNIDTGYISTDGSILLEMGDKALLNIAARHLHTIQTLVEEEMIGGRGDSFALTANDGGDYEDAVPPLEEDCGDGGDAAGMPFQPSEEQGVDVPRRSERKRVTFAGPAVKSKPAVDPWAQLDPFEKSKIPDKPFKKKKTFKLPPELENNTSKKRKKKTNASADLPPIHEVVESLFSHRVKFPKSPLKIPEFPELDDAFWNEYKLRQQIKKEEIKKLKKEEQEALRNAEENDEEEDAAEFPLNPDDEDDGELDIPPLQLDPDLFVDHSNARRITYGTDMGCNASLSDEITLSYEDLVVRHVEKFLASAAEYAQITELSRRVAEWEEKIRPRLEEEEGHEPFDIHKYGTRIIEQLVRGERKAFKDLVRGKQKFEICRYTLATLQLANVYNVELAIVPEQNGNIMDCLFVTLLSVKRHFEDLEEYRAPSLKST